MHPRWLFGISSINSSTVGGGGQIQIQVQKQNIMADQVMEDLKNFNIEDWNEASNYQEWSKDNWEDDKRDVKPSNHDI